MVVCLPLMAAIQEISARIGRISGRGIAGNIRRHYSAWLLYPLIFLLVVANTINIGADIGAMGDGVRLLVGDRRFCIRWCSRFCVWFFRSLHPIRDVRRFLNG